MVITTNTSIVVHTAWLLVWLSYLSHINLNATKFLGMRDVGPSHFESLQLPMIMAVQLEIQIHHPELEYS